MRHHNLCTFIFWYCKMVDLLSVVLSPEQYSEQPLWWVSDFIWPREVLSSSVQGILLRKTTDWSGSKWLRNVERWMKWHVLLNFKRTQRIIAEDSTYFRPYTCFANKHSDHRKIPPFHVLLVLVVKEETTEQRLQSSVTFFRMDLFKCWTVFHMMLVLLQTVMWLKL